MNTAFQQERGTPKPTHGNGSNRGEGAAETTFTKWQLKTPCSPRFTEEQRPTAARNSANLKSTKAEDAPGWHISVKMARPKARQRPANGRSWQPQGRPVRAAATTPAAEQRPGAVHEGPGAQRAPASHDH